jgi:hypothetical protein
MPIWPERFEMPAVNNSTTKGKIMLMIFLAEDILFHQKKGAQVIPTIPHSGARGSFELNFRAEYVGFVFPSNTAHLPINEE